MGYYETWVLLHYQLLPTDERFLALRPWECSWLFWLNHYHLKIERAKMKAASTGDKLNIEEVLSDVEDSMSDDEFMAKVAELDAVDDAVASGLPIPKATAPEDKPDEVVTDFSVTPPWMARGMAGG